MARKLMAMRNSGKHRWTTETVGNTSGSQNHQGPLGRFSNCLGDAQEQAADLLMYGKAALWFAEKDVTGPERQGDRWSS